MSTMPRYFSDHGASSPLLASFTGAHSTLCSARILAASTIEAVLGMVMTLPEGGAGKEDTERDWKKPLSLAIVAVCVSA